MLISATSIPSQLAFRISRFGVSHGYFGATVANAKTANVSNPKFELQCSTSCPEGVAAMDTLRAFLSLQVAQRVLSLRTIGIKRIAFEQTNPGCNKGWGGVSRSGVELEQFP